MTPHVMPPPDRPPHRPPAAGPPRLWGFWLFVVAFVLVTAPLWCGPSW